MKIENSIINGVYLITPDVFGDERGYFMESYNAEKLNQGIGREVQFVQDNESRSSYGVLRGFAFQKGEYAQAKLVRVTEGSVLDVVVDMRKDSQTFGKYVMHELTAENKKQVFIPRGCAHAFLTLSDHATFHYKVDNKFAPEQEAGFRFDDMDIAVDWPIDKESLVISEKDLSRPKFKDAYTFKE